MQGRATNAALLTGFLMLLTNPKSEQTGSTIMRMVTSGKTDKKAAGCILT
jgi:hypothetical protein